MLEEKHHKRVPLISVLLPVYNDTEYLEEAIQSILNQSFGDFELLILDDGSDIPIYKIVNTFKDERIQYHRFDHQGLTCTLNRGLTLSRSTYIARQDADDISLPDRFKYLISIFENDPCIALVGSSCQFIDERGNIVRTCSYPTEHKTLVQYLEQMRNPFPHSSVIFRRNVVVKLGGYKSRFLRVQDYELWLRISEKYKIASCPEQLCQIRFRNRSVAHSAGTPNQFKFTLLGYILHKRRTKMSKEISESEWGSYLNRYEQWYYQEIAPKLSDVWTPRCKFAYALHKGDLLQSGVYLGQIFRELLKRIIEPDIKRVISQIPEEFLN